MAVYKINDQAVHVEESGNPNRQIALLIHGWSSSSYALSPLMEMLSKRFRCMAVDLPGYGKSPKFAGKTTIPAYADLLAGLIEQVAEGPVVLIGHSMGGMISLTLTERYPMLVDRTVLICPTITGKLSNYINLFVSPITAAERFKVGQIISGWVSNAVVGITDRIMRPASFAQRTVITEDEYVRLRSDARQPNQGTVRAECYRAMRENDLSGRLGNIETPSLVIWGAEDNTVPLRDSGVVADEWPEAELRILPKAGHWPHFERPDATKRLIASFLGLPILRGNLHVSSNDDSLAQIEEAAAFLAHSDLGSNLNLTQRKRLASQCTRRIFKVGETIVKVSDRGNEMFIIQDGTVDVWADPDSPGENTSNMRQVATLRPGQITGEMALFDEGTRSANLVAGANGAVVLVLHRDQMQDLCEADPTLGTRVLWNMSRAISLRVRFIQWQNRNRTSGSNTEETIRMFVPPAKLFEGLSAD
ncbi:MAG: alpha/beta fold hydrolase [Ardenticatenaceae bacterium]|nr:alpha/beta fold hydrolase [Ardenticatenaceae bacterium]